MSQLLEGAVNLTPQLLEKLRKQYQTITRPDEIPDGLYSLYNQTFGSFDAIVAEKENKIQFCLPEDEASANREREELAQQKNYVAAAKFVRDFMQAFLPSTPMAFVPTLEQIQLAITVFGQVLENPQQENPTAEALVQSIIEHQTSKTNRYHNEVIHYQFEHEISQQRKDLEERKASLPYIKQIEGIDPVESPYQIIAIRDNLAKSDAPQEDVKNLFEVVRIGMGTRALNERERFLAAADVTIDYQNFHFILKEHVNHLRKTARIGFDCSDPKRVDALIDRALHIIARQWTPNADQYFPPSPELDGLTKQELDFLESFKPYVSELYDRFLNIMRSSDSETAEEDINQLAETQFDEATEVRFISVLGKIADSVEKVLSTGTPLLPKFVPPEKRMEEKFRLRPEDVESLKGEQERAERLRPKPQQAATEPWRNPVPAEERPIPTWEGVPQQDIYRFTAPDAPNKQNAANVHEAYRLHFAPLANRYQNAEIFNRLLQDPLADAMHPLIASIRAINAAPTPDQMDQGFLDRVYSQANSALTAINRELSTMDYATERYAMLSQARQIFTQYQISAAAVRKDFVLRANTRRNVQINQITKLYQNKLKPLIENPQTPLRKRDEAYRKLIEKLDADRKVTDPELLLTNLNNETKAAYLKAKRVVEAYGDPSLLSLDYDRISDFVQSSQSAIDREINTHKQQFGTGTSHSKLEFEIAEVARKHRLTTELSTKFVEGVFTQMYEASANGQKLTAEQLLKNLQKKDEFQGVLYDEHVHLVKYAMTKWEYGLANMEAKLPALEERLKDLEAVQEYAMCRARLQAAQQLTAPVRAAEHEPVPALQEQLTALSAELGKMRKFGINTTAFNNFSTALLEAAASGNTARLQQAATTYVAEKTKNGKEPRTQSGRGRLQLARSVVDLLNTYRNIEQTQENTIDGMSTVSNPPKLHIYEELGKLPLDHLSADKAKVWEEKRLQAVLTEKSEVQANEDQAFLDNYDEHSELSAIPNEVENNLKEHFGDVSFIEQTDHSDLHLDSAEIAAFELQPKIDEKTLVQKNKESVFLAERRLKEMSKQTQPFTDAQKEEAHHHMQTIAIGCALELTHRRLSDNDKAQLENNPAVFHKICTNLLNDKKLMALLPKKADITPQIAGSINRTFIAQAINQKVAGTNLVPSNNVPNKSKQNNL